MSDPRRQSIANIDPSGFARQATLLLLLLVAIDIAVIQIFWRDINIDLRDDLIPWYRFILKAGRFGAFQ